MVSSYSPLFLMFCSCCRRAASHRVRVVFRLFIAKKKQFDTALLTRSISVRNRRNVATHEHWVRRKHKNLSLLLCGCQLTACSTLYSQLYSGTLYDSRFIDVRAAHICANVHVFRQWFVSIVDIFIIPLYILRLSSSFLLARSPQSAHIILTRRGITSFGFSPLFMYFYLLSVRPSSKRNKLRFNLFRAAFANHLRSGFRFSHFTYSLTNHFEHGNGFGSGFLFRSIQGHCNRTHCRIRWEEEEEENEPRRCRIGARVCWCVCECVCVRSTHEININGIILMLLLCHIKFSYNISASWIHFITSTFTSSLHSFSTRFHASE